MVEWGNLEKVLGLAGTVAVFSLGYLLRFFLERKRSSELEKERAAYAVELEQLKGELQKRQVRFAATQEEISTTVRSTHKRLLKLERDLRSYALSRTKHGEYGVKEWTIVYSQGISLRRFVEDKRIYMAEETYQLVMVALKMLTSVTILLNSDQAENMLASDEKRLVARNEFTRAFEILERDFPNAMDEVREHFRGLLGVV